MMGDVVNYTYTNDTKVVYHLSDFQYIEGKPPGTLMNINQL